jgi:hypothetical protein
MLCAVGLVAAGASAALLSAGPPTEFGRVVVPAPPAPTEAPPSGSLDERLAPIADAAKITPGQQDVWHRFVMAVAAVEQMSRDYDTRVAAGEKPDLFAERARHTLAIGAALNELGEALTPAQAAIVRRLTDDLTKTVICRNVLSS